VGPCREPNCLLLDQSPRLTTRGVRVGSSSSKNWIPLYQNGFCSADEFHRFPFSGGSETLIGWVALRWFKFSVRFKPHRRKIRFNTGVIPRNRIAEMSEVV
jgi:hypothetical protein